MRNVWAGIVLAAAGCATGAPVGVAAGAPSAIIQVTNNRFLDATVYATPEHSNPIRLGVVTGHSTRNFRFTDSVWRGRGFVRVQVFCREIGSMAISCRDAQAVGDGDIMRVMTFP